MHLPSLRLKHYWRHLHDQRTGTHRKGRCGLASRSDRLRRRVFARLGVVMEVRLAVRFQRQKCMGSSMLGTRRCRSTEFGGVLSSEVSMY